MSAAEDFRSDQYLAGRIANIEERLFGDLWAQSYRDALDRLSVRRAHLEWVREGRLSTPTVTRIVNSRESHIEPPLNPEWSDLEKLRWNAAIASMDSGLEVRVGPSRFFINQVEQPGYFNVLIGRSSCAPHDFHSAWTLINGVAIAGDQLRCKPSNAGSRASRRSQHP